MKRGFAAILILIGAVLMLSISVGVYFLGKSVSSNPQKSIQTALSQSQQPSPSTSVNLYLEPLTANAIWLTQNLAWDIPKDSIPLNELQQLQDVFHRLDIVAPNKTYYSLISGEVTEQWGVFDAIEKPKPPETFQTTGTLTFIAQKVQGVWRISKQGDKDFCDYLKAAPDNLNLISKDYFIGCK